MKLITNSASGTSVPALVFVLAATLTQKQSPPLRPLLQGVRTPSMSYLLFEGMKLEFCLSEYDYAHGIGVKSVFSHDESEVGIIIFLCDKSDDRYDSVSQKSIEELIQALQTGIEKGIFNENIKNMFHWQSEIGKLGHNYSSPIYGQLANVF